MLFLTFCFLTGAFWQLAEGNAETGTKLQLAGGSCAFISCLAGYYLFFVQIMAAVDMPFSLPVFDMSTFIKGASDRRRVNESAA